MMQRAVQSRTRSQSAPRANSRDTEAREEGYCWLVLGPEPAEIAHWVRGRIVAVPQRSTVAAGRSDRHQRHARVQAPVVSVA